MNGITQYQSERPNAGIIYAGLVGHYCNVEPRLKQPKKMKNADYIAAFMGFIENPDDFLKDKQGREVFSFAELSEYLNINANHLSKNTPYKYKVCSNKKALEFIGVIESKRIVGGGNCGFSVKNHFMWNTSSTADVNKYLKKFRAKGDIVGGVWVSANGAS